jgi:hypothetical protein
VTLTVTLASFSWFNPNTTNHYHSNKSNNVATYHFGFCIQPTANTGLVSYAIIGEKNGVVVSKQPLSLINFILQVKGKQYSVANPFFRDLFKENGLDSCFYHYDLIKDVYGALKCFSIDDLWMLRYSRNPLCGDGCIPTEGMKTEGWASNKFKPNDLQMAILEKYGILHFNHFIYGENMFRLFIDMAVSDWQEAYKTAGTTVSE